MSISIVTISYNQGRYLARALDSVLSQIRADGQYIVVDAGSTDGSVELLKSYAHKGVRVIVEPDDGPADGLNKGFSNATGQILGYLNADDVYLPGSLAFVQRYFRAHPEHDVLCGAAYIVDENEHVKKFFPPDPYSLYRHTHGAGIVSQQSTFFRQSAFQRTQGFNRLNRTCWDAELLISMVRTGAKVGRSRRPLALFRAHESSITGSQRMAAAYRRDSERLFTEVNGHSPSLLDRAAVIAVGLEKHLRNAPWHLLDLARRARLWPKSN